MILDGGEEQNIRSEMNKFYFRNRASSFSGTMIVRIHT